MSPSSLEHLLGKQLLGPAGSTVDTSSILGPNKVVALYFSAHWCPPCRRFTPELASIYKRFKAKHARGADLSVVFVSSDQDAKAFNEYFAEMPWLALPYADRERKADLSTMFSITGIPSLVLLDGSSGKVISSEGRKLVTEDPELKEFPWTAKPLMQLLKGAQLVNEAGETSKAEKVLKGKVKLLYFSTNWCGTCSTFTPRLARTYKALKAAGRDFELVFASVDQDEAGFKECFKTMPWLALDLKDRSYEERLNRLTSAYGIDSVPCLVVVAEDDKVLCLNACQAVERDPRGMAFPWGAEAAEEAEGGSDSMHATVGCGWWKALFRRS